MPLSHYNLYSKYVWISEPPRTRGEIFQGGEMFQGIRLMCTTYETLSKIELHTDQDHSYRNPECFCHPTIFSVPLARISSIDDLFGHIFELY